MSDLSDTIKGFYSEFILRDLLSFVTPGAIVVGASIIALSDLVMGSNFRLLDFLFIFNHIPIFIWILLFGLFYIIGLGLQYIREFFPCLKFPPIEYRNKYRDNDKKIKIENNDSIPIDEKGQFKRNFGCDEHFRNSKYYAEFRLPFIEKTRSFKGQPFEVERKTEERFIVIMQASGNSATAFIITGIIGIICLINPIFQSISWIIYSISCFVLFIILIKNYEIHRQRLLDWELEVNYPHILISRSFSRSHSRRRR